MRTKYIVGELPSSLGTVLGAVVFQEFVSHEHMAKVFDQDEELVSAGFFSIQDGQVVPYGRSVSLGLDSRAEDAALIAKAIGLHPNSR